MKRQIFYAQKRSIFFLLIVLLSATQLFATDYYSNKTGNFTTPSNWGKNTDGSGDNPQIVDFTSGQHKFIINTGHIISLNDSINCADIDIKGTLTFGNNTEARSLVTKNFKVQSGGTVNVGQFNAFHHLYINGNFTNNGTINLRNNSSQVVDVEFKGSFNLDGTGTPIFNNITFKSETRTVSIAINIDGSVIIENGATFESAEDITHTVAGNWIEYGNGQITNGNINFDGTLVQSVSMATFDNVIFSKGGLVNFTGVLQVNKNFEITENTKINTDRVVKIGGNFTVQKGSTFEADRYGTLQIDGTETQNLTILGDCKFGGISFQNGSDTQRKIITGDATFGGNVTVFAGAFVESTGIISFAYGLDMQGKWDFKEKQVYLKGGNFYNSKDDNVISFGNSEIIVEGPIYLGYIRATSNQVKVRKNFTVNSGFVRINENTLLTYEGGANHTLSLKAGASLVIDGENNFPNFPNYDFDKESSVNYSSLADQNVKGGIVYGNIDFSGKGTKTVVDRGLTILSRMRISGDITVDLKGFEHILEGSLMGQNTTVISSQGGKFIFSGEAQIISKMKKIQFYNLEFKNSGAKYIYGDILLTGNFLARNQQGGTSVMNIQTYGNRIIKSNTNTGTATFTLEGNVILTTPHADNFNAMSNDFQMNLGKESIIYFMLHNTPQKIPGISYGSIYFWGNGRKELQGNISIKKDIKNTGYTPLLIDNGHDINIAGDWVLSFTNTPSPTSTVTFDGENQQINSSNFNNIVFSGSQTKSLAGHIKVKENLTINNNVTFDANTFNINIGGNWSNSGTGVFTQTTGITTFDGVEKDQEINGNYTNEFGSLTIQKIGATKTLIANSNIDVNGNFTFVAAKGDFDLNGHTAKIGGNWTINAACNFIHNSGKLVFDGTATQMLSNNNPDTKYYDIEFKTPSSKRLYGKPFIIERNVLINDASVTADADMNVKGNWTNTGIFNGSLKKVTFDGENQSISNSNFGNLVIGGTGIKTLEGNISCLGSITINEGATLDVSENNHTVNLLSNWTNDGTFVCRRGTVKFDGGYSNIKTGGIQEGKTFYNLTINVRSQYKRLYPEENNPLKVLNNFALDAINNAPFYFYKSNIYIGGDFINKGANFYQLQTSDTSTIFFTAKTGTYSMDFGTHVVQSHIIINGGATYKMKKDLSIRQNRNLKIQKGRLELNRNTLTMQLGNIYISSEGEIEIDANATLQVSNSKDAIINEGSFEIVGTSTAPAVLTSLGWFQYTQQGARARIKAKYFSISKLNKKGMYLKGGKIFPEYAFTHGLFASAYQTTAYLTLGENLELKVNGKNLVATNTTFASEGYSPTYNVQNLGCTGTITFKNSAGGLAGEDFDNEPEGTDNVKWEFPERITWDGEGGDADWHNAQNWNPNKVPTAADEVLLDNSIVNATYSVEISQSDVKVKKLTIVGSQNITLTLNSKELEIEKDIEINKNGTFAQTTATDTLKIGGNFSNLGTYQHNNVGVVKFNPLAGEYKTINSKPAFCYFIIATDTLTTSLRLSSDIVVDKDFLLLRGTLSCSNKKIYVKENWEVSNTAKFDHGTSSVYFNGASQEQNISGGIFHNVFFEESAQKNILKNIDVKNIFEIKQNAKVNAGENTVYMNYFRNFAGIDGFIQTGEGTAIFSSTGYIQGEDAKEKPTKFNHLIFQGGGNKTIYSPVTLIGHLTIKGGNVFLEETANIDGTAENDYFIMNNGSFTLYGEDNFPKNFKEIILNGGRVIYSRDNKQNIFPTTYSTLQLNKRNNNEQTTTKTASGDIRVLGNFDILDNKTILDMNSHTVNIAGAFTMKSGGEQVTWGDNGSIVFDGKTQRIDINMTKFNNIKKIGQYNLEVSNKIEVSGNFIIGEENALLVKDGAGITSTGTDKRFVLSRGSNIFSYVLKDNGVGFPKNFTYNDLDETSTANYSANGNQKIYTKNGTIVYGNLLVGTPPTTTATTEIDNILRVKGNFQSGQVNTTFEDKGFDMFIGGNYSARKYTPTNTITFNGIDQTISANSLDTLKFNHLIIKGERGTKMMVNNLHPINIKGNLTISENDTLDVRQNVLFNGENFVNKGAFYQLIATTNITFGGENQTINPGAKNTFPSLKFTNGNTKKFVENGIQKAVGNSFEISGGTKVDLGNLTHHIAIPHFNFENPAVDSLLATQAHIDFNRVNIQWIPKLKVKTIEFSSGYFSYMTDTIWTEDIKINAEDGLIMGDDRGNTFPLFVYGNFENNGAFNSKEQTIFFESKDTEEKIITNNKPIHWNNNRLYTVKFNQKHTKKRTYKIVGETGIADQLTIGSGATLKLNGQKVYLGRNVGRTEHNEVHTIQSGGTLDVDADANLLFGGNPPNQSPKLIAENGATFRMVGTPDKYAKVNPNGLAYHIEIKNGAKIQAKYYVIKGIYANGLEVENGAIIDPDFNFSDGIFLDIFTGTHDLQQKRYYLNIDTDVSSIGTIKNVVFNHSSSPASGTFFNVKRGTNAQGIIKFGGVIKGLLAGEKYEDEGNGSSVEGGSITWPQISSVSWTGKVSTDWFNPSNWSPEQVPNETLDAIIPPVINNPIINTTDTAKCNKLEIVGGILTLETGHLKTKDDVSLGSNSVLAVANPNTSINVGKSWDARESSRFIHGGGTVKMILVNGEANIFPRKTIFGNFEINGNGTFHLISSITIEKDFTLTKGILASNHRSYQIEVGGNFKRTDGELFLSQLGTIVFNGADQSIENGIFKNVKIEGTGTKTVKTHFEAAALEVSSTLKAENISMLITGNMLIKATGIFDDGNQVHHFRGADWKTEEGAIYRGQGTILLDGNGWHNIYKASFYNLTMNTVLSRECRLLGDVEVKGNLTINNGRLRCSTHQINNRTGTGTFLMEAGEIYISGKDNYPKGFKKYLAKPTTSQIYDRIGDQKIRGKTTGSTPLTYYGNLIVRQSGTKTLDGDIIAQSSLKIEGNTQLDVSERNYKINVGRYWENLQEGTFLCRKGEVIFDYPTTTTSIIRFNEGKNDFYKLTIDSKSSYTNVYADIVVKNNLSVFGSHFVGYKTVTVYGDLVASGTGKFHMGEYRLKKPSGTAYIRSNGSIFLKMLIDGGAEIEYKLLDDYKNNGWLEIKSGIFDGNGKTVSLSTTNLSGTYKIGSGGVLNIGNYKTFTVLDKGVFEALGDKQNIATVSSVTNSSYNFFVESGGTIKAEYYRFERMGFSGIFLKKGSIIDHEKHFSRGSFAYPAIGGTCLRIENEQSFSSGNRIEDVVFIGGNASNVAKNSSTIGSLEFYNAAGNLSGEKYDDDPNELISWTGVVELVWTGNVDNDWFKPGNWQANIGPNKIPTINDNVIIAKTFNQPKIGDIGAVAKRIEIRIGASLTINKPQATDTILKVKEDIINNGSFAMNQLGEIIYVGGNWISKEATSYFLPRQGTVVLKSLSGYSTVNMKSSSFNQLIIDTEGTVRLLSDLKVNKELRIAKGKLDVGTSTLEIKGNFINQATFEPQMQEVLFNNTEAGTNTIDIGNSKFYKLRLEAGQDVVYLLQRNTTVTDDVVLKGGTLQLNKKSLLVGNRIRNNIISIENSTLYIDAGAQLKMYNGSKIEVKSGGILKMIGESSDALATITHNEQGKYEVVLKAGAKLAAKYYDVSYINQDGIHFKTGSTIDLNNNLSNGFFSNGQSNGQYLWFENELPENYTIKDVIFNSGASFNVKRTEGTNPVTFKDAFGLRGGYLYEKDEETLPAATSGLVRWSYTQPILTWTGDDYQNNVNWNNQNNWNPHRIPQSTDNVFIPNVEDEKDPIIQVQNGEAMNITIYEGGKLTIKNDRKLTINKNLSGAGKILVEEGSNTIIEVGENWDNLGIFEHGGSSTVKFTKESGIIDINPGNNPFYNIEFNSSNSAIFRTLNRFDVDGDFTISQNTTFKIMSATHSLNIGGNFTNKGTFDAGTAVVTFDGSGNQILKKEGNSQTFSKLVFAGTAGIKSIEGNIKILKEILIQENNTIKGGSSTISLLGNWRNNGNFIPETSTVIFEGNTIQNIFKQGVEEFNTLKINNSANPTAVKIETDVKIKNTLDLTNGILETSHSSFLNILDGASITNASENSYVSGPMRKIGSTDFVFPVGKGSVYARLAISDLGTNNSTFQVEYLDEKPTNRTSIEEPLSEISLVEHWSLERKEGIATPKVKLYFADSIRSKIDKMRDVVVAVYDKTTTPNSWKTAGKKPATRDGKGGWVQSENGITNFGRIAIGFEYPTARWTGNQDNNWHNENNWDFGDGEKGVPNHKVNVEISNTASNQPVIYQNNAKSYNLKINAGAYLTIQSNKNLEIVGKGNISENATFTIDDASNSEVIVNKTFENLGNFIPGNASTVTYARLEKQDITLTEFCNLKIDGRQEKTIKNDILIKGNLTINSILEGKNFKITLVGNWKNNGNFYRGNSEVILVGDKKQTISKEGNGESFYNLTINNNSTTKPQIELLGNVTVDHVLDMKKGNILSTNSRLLTLSQGATADNHSTNSYVVGPIRKFGTDDFVFPVGRGDVYARIALTNLTGNAVFIAEYFNRSAPDIDKMDTDIKAVSAVEYWTVKRTNNYTAKVTLYYEDSIRSRIGNPDSLRVVHYTEGTWQNEGNEGNGSRQKAGWVKSGQFSSFSPITFGTINENDPLPIELTRFEANVQEKNVKLDWETATEINNDYFTIERTTDGKNIKQIAKVKGAGNSFSPNYYTFMDKKPQQGINYYRLKQTDFDGKSKIYNWLSVVYDAPVSYSNLLVEVYPNPGKLAEMKVKIKSQQTKQVSVEIISMIGKRILLHHLSINEGEEYILELNKLKLEQGIYLLNIIADKKQKQIKFIVE